MKGNFFSRLAERTLGVAPLVKPDLLPVFAATPESATASNSIPGRGETNSVPLQQRADSTVRGFDRARGSNRNAETPRTSSRSGQPSADFPWRHDDPFDRKIEAAQQLAESAEASANLRSREFTELEPQHGQREMATSRGYSLAQITDRIYATPVAAPPESSNTINAPAPSIRISIGTVEVRAVAPPTSAPRAVERKATPRLSLEHYLRERNERRR